MKCLDQVTLAVVGIDVKFGIRHTVRLFHVFYPTSFRRERKQHGHLVSKALPLWRTSICHHKMFNTRRAVKQFCHSSSVYVCVHFCAYMRLGGEQLGVCIIDFDVCVE